MGRHASPGQSRQAEPWLQTKVFVAAE